MDKKRQPHFPIANYTIIPSTHKYERINFYLRSIDRNMRTILCILFVDVAFVTMFTLTQSSAFNVATPLRLPLSLSLAMCVSVPNLWPSRRGNWKHTATRITADKIKLTSFSFCGIGSDAFWTGFSSSIKFAQRTFSVSEKSIRRCLFFARNECGH